MQSFQLIIKQGPFPGKVYPLDKDQMIIGRDTGADVLIADAEVSRKHAQLYLQGGGYVLEDLGSTNGCFINGQRLNGPQALHAGDTIALGEKISLKYEAIQSDPEATVASMPSFAPPPRPSNFPPPRQPRRPRRRPPGNRSPRRRPHHPRFTATRSPPGRMSCSQPWKRPRRIPAPGSSPAAAVCCFCCASAARWAGVLTV